MQYLCDFYGIGSAIHRRSVCKYSRSIFDFAIILSIGEREHYSGVCVFAALVVFDREPSHYRPEWRGYFLYPPPVCYVNIKVKFTK